MAMHDEIKEQQNKLKGKTFKEKFGYFWEYYRVHTFVIIIVIVVGAIFIRDAASQKDYAFSATILNSLGNEYQEDFQNDFAEYADIDLETYSCFIDTASSLSYDTMSQMDMAVSQRIVAMAQTDGIDIIISDNKPFTNFSDGMMFTDLRDELTKEEYEKYEPYFYYVDAAVIYDDEVEIAYDEDGMPLMVDTETDHSDPSAMEDPMPVGIYITDSAKLKEWHCYPDTSVTPILGFVQTSVRKEISHLFLQYIMEE